MYCIISYFSMYIFCIRYVTHSFSQTRNVCLNCLSDNCLLILCEVGTWKSSAFVRTCTAPCGKKTKQTQTLFTSREQTKILAADSQQCPSDFLPFQTCLFPKIYFSLKFRSFQLSICVSIEMPYCFCDCHFNFIES